MITTPKRSQDGLTFKLTYSDSHGTEHTHIRSRGRFMETTLRGVDFDCDDMDCLTPKEGQDPKLISQFQFHNRDVCDCLISVEIPVLAKIDQQETEIDFTFTIDLGPPNKERPHSLTHRIYTISTILPDETKLESRTGSIEDSLLQIISQLPDTIELRCCFTCAFSDYSPTGNCEFGTMLCFRNIKDEYSQLKGKDILDLQEDDLVQETDYCKEWQQRKPDTGYRG
ncbi:MAG: DUF6304 family protein [Verrucomicrobiota bacterium]